MKFSRFIPLADTIADKHTTKALELFDRGDHYELDGQRDWAKGCDVKALRHLESSFIARRGLVAYPDQSPIGIVPVGVPKNGR